MSLDEQVRERLETGRYDDYVTHLHSLDGQLTHPASQSALYARLGDAALWAGARTEAARHFQTVIDLGVTRSDVEAAKMRLYDMGALQPGRIAPDFSAVTIDGEAIQLSDFRGSIVLLDFWATGCGPCHPEFPILRTLRERYTLDALRIIGISKDQSEEQLREVAGKEQMSWPQIREPTEFEDGAMVLGPVSTLYAVLMIPRTILIGRQGLIVAKDLRGEKLLEAVRALETP